MSCDGVEALLHVHIGVNVMPGIILKVVNPQQDFPAKLSILQSKDFAKKQGEPKFLSWVLAKLDVFFCDVPI